MKRAVTVVGRTLVPHARVLLPGDAFGERRRKARLADTRLPRDQHDLPLPLPGEALACQQEIDLVLAADEIGQTSGADCLETALGDRYAFNCPRRDRLGNTLHPMRAEVAQTKQIAEQPARGGANHDRPRLRQSLKPGCEVRRVPDESVLPQRTLTAEVADYDYTCGNPNADRKRFRGRGFQYRNRSNDIERRPHGTFGI